MAWSTREVAELAGTSLRAVRHYHEVGLLDEPERNSNGYKQYGVSHLLRVLRIKRLSDLGFSLSQIAALGDADDHPEEALRAVDAELAATIESLERARLELAVIMHGSGPVDLPVGFPTPTAPTDRSLLVVLAQLLGPRGRRTYAEVLQAFPPTAEDRELDELPADATEDMRQGLAERLAPQVRAIYEAYPELREPNSDAPRGTRFANQTMGAAMRDVYHSAQLDVLRRLSKLVSNTP